MLLHELCSFGNYIYKLKRKSITGTWDEPCPSGKSKHRSTSLVPLFGNNNCLSRSFLHLHITAALILGFQICKNVAKNYVSSPPPPFSNVAGQWEKDWRDVSQSTCALRCCESLHAGRKKKSLVQRTTETVPPSTAASSSYVAGERLVSAEWRGWSGKAALLQTAVSLTDNGWPGSIWKQQPWTNMMYTSSLANGCHQFRLHHGDRRRRRWWPSQEQWGNVTNSS